MVYHVNNNVILSGPHAVSSDYVRKLTRCGTPEVLDLSAYDLVPEWREPVSAPLGWADPVIEERDGATVVAVYAAGTAEERAAAEQSAYLDGLACDALQAVDELLDRNMWSNVRLWATQQDERTQEYFLRAKTWRYRDERLQAGATALGLTDAQLIEILEAARQR